ncbi:type IV pilin [Haloarcula sp. JP-Z28]|jgi:flagellin-like protein|uniref:Type IV pilin n=1 Tax=Haloarcula marismortui ATCC 33800 TaxID=662476 RepID=M0JMF3_9EURY|nr:MULTISPECIES: type IV pilin [Haloarcula]EMA09159.1 hypothetical protein C436_19568 [Haloarcula sinaiiensis ATCC 33800]NHN66021.1 type IV pilin [Haloarcula sp. JP-Z28]QUJ74191.1 type IV pilin [Haloarcula sinaiiensis ATCC 33800]
MEIPQSPRAVSPVVSTILLVAIVVILGTTISVLALGVTDDLNDAGPVVGQSTAEFIGDRSGADDQIVRITHIAGDSVAVSEMELVVRACGKATRLINLPAPTTRTASTPTYFPFDEGNFQGNQDLLSEGTVGQSWDAGVLHEDTTNTFAAGSSFEFRITNGACSLAAGETIEVMVVHSPTNTVMIDTELTAQ